MNLNQLRYFQSICKYNSITKAAEFENISQPSISNALKDLEYELGLNLFKRVNNKLIITKEGEFFLNRVTKILDDIDDLYLTMRNKGGHNTSMIKLGVGPILGICLFSEIFKEYKKVYPNVIIELYEEYHLTLRKMVEDNDIDFSFTIMDNNYSDNLIVDFITEFELCFCVKKDSSLAEKKLLNVNSIKNEPIVFYKPDSYHYNVLKELYEKYNCKPNIIFSTNRPDVIKNYIKENNASAFLIKDLISENDNITPISFEEPIMIKMGLVRNKNKILFNNKKNFYEFVLSLYKNIN